MIRDVERRSDTERRMLRTDPPDRKRRGITKEEVYGYSEGRQKETQKAGRNGDIIFTVATSKGNSRERKTLLER